MTALAWLLPVALFLGGLGLGAFLWSLQSGQYDDLEGAGWRALDDECAVDIEDSDISAPDPANPSTGNNVRGNL
jgi:cbb3-type cytochrome oxidase maturation protein